MAEARIAAAAAASIRTAAPRKAVPPPRTHGDAGRGDWGGFARPSNFRALGARCGRAAEGGSEGDSSLHHFFIGRFLQRGRRDSVDVGTHRVRVPHGSRRPVGLKKRNVTLGFCGITNLILSESAHTSPAGRLSFLKQPSRCVDTLNDDSPARETGNRSMIAKALGVGCAKNDVAATRSPGSSRAAAARAEAGNDEIMDRYFLASAERFPPFWLPSDFFPEREGAGWRRSGLIKGFPFDWPPPPWTLPILRERGGVTSGG